MSDVTLVEYFFCGGFGGICAILLGHPFDTVKVRLQTMPAAKPGKPPLYSGTLHCIRKSIKSEGITCLYKGMGTPLAGVAPIYAICFMGCGVGKKIFGPSDGSPLTYTQLFAAGTFGGFFTGLVTAPGDRIKCLLQVQQSVHAEKIYDGPLDCISKLYKRGGISSIFKGVGATVLRDGPSNGVYFLTYDVLQGYFTNKGREPPGVLGTILAGGLSGITCWVLAAPADVLKSRLQTAPEGVYKNGIRDVFKELIETEGVLGLYKGIRPIMIRAFVGNSSCFLGFELCREFLNSIWSKPEHV